MAKYDILIPGHYVCDIVFTGINGHPELGKNLFSEGLSIVPGGVVNTVIALQRLQANVGWIGAVGDDTFSRFMLYHADKENLDTGMLARMDTPLRFVTVALSYPEDRAFISYHDESPDLLDMVLARLNEVDCPHLHFGELFVDERMPDLLKRCHEKGMFISSDCQYGEETLDSPLVCNIISSLDMFIPNASEVKALTGIDDLDKAARKLTEFVPYLVIKDGKHGAHAYHEGAHYHQESIDVEPFDTTGAGDVFNAGFLAAHLKGYDVQICLQWAVLAGGFATQGPGGTSTAPTLEQLQFHLEKSNLKS